MTQEERSTFSHRLATLLVARPWPALILSVVLIGLLLPGIGKMEADFTYRIWFEDDDPLLQRFESFERRFGSDDNVAVLVHSPSGVFDEDSATVIHDLTAELWKVPEIIRVDSLANYNWTHAEGDEIVVEPLLGDGDLGPVELAARREVAIHHEVLPNYLVSEDAKTAILYGTIKPSFTGSPDYQLIIHGDPASEPSREGVRDKVAAFSGHTDHEFYITGSAAISDAFREAGQQDIRKMLPILLGAIVILLLVLLRKVSGVILPFVIIFATVMMTFGLAGDAGFKFNIVLSMLPNILIAICIADSVHILATFLQLRRAGLERREAVRETLVKNLWPTFLTSLSTAVGFLSFATADLVPLAHLGFLAGFGTLAAWVVTILFLAPLLAILPIRVEPVSAGGAETGALDKPLPWASRGATLIASQKVAIIVVFVVLASASVWIGLGNEVNANPFRYFAEDFPLQRAQRFMEEHVGGAIGPEIVIDSGRPDGVKDPEFLTRVKTFQDWLNARPYVTKTVSIVDVLQQVNRSLHGDDPSWYRLPESQSEIAEQLFLYTMSLPQGMDLNDRVTIDNDALRMTVLWTLQTSKESVAEAARMEAKAAELGLDAVVTGKMMLYRSMNDYVVRAYLTSLVLAVVAIAALLMIALRSVKLGLLSMIPNAVPLALGAGLMALLDKPLDIGTVLVSSVCLGIAVDDTIHFLTNFRRNVELGHGRSTAVAMVFSYTGPALAVTTLVLMIGFGTFAFASYMPNVNFGILTALILSTALVTDLVLLPALVLIRRPPS